jgi:hypothetical protein
LQTFAWRRCSFNSYPVLSYNGLFIFRSSDIRWIAVCFTPK